MYFEEGNPRRFVVPDVFVAKGCPRGDRRTFKLWDEAGVPNFVIEVTSPSTKHVDLKSKPDTYSAIGVGEFVMFDPLNEYLNPALRMLRLNGNRYEAVEPDSSGRLYSEELNLFLFLNGTELVMQDAQTGRPLPTDAEAEARIAADEARVTAEQRITQLEAELRRLRESQRSS